MRSIFTGSGMSAGLCSSSFVPSVRWISVNHRRRGGDQVEIELALKALLMISRCRRPRKPQRKPKPSAADVSISNEKLASLSAACPWRAQILEVAASTGKRPQNTTGCAGLKPGSASAQGFFSVMVSPTRVSATSLIEAVMSRSRPAQFVEHFLGVNDADAVDGHRPRPCPSS
jgi:hypothetical protein